MQLKPIDLQLVALVRVVIARAVIWLPDQPTASLDSESEAKFGQNWSTTSVWRISAVNYFL